MSKQFTNSTRFIGKRCGALANERDVIKGRAGFHWWPKIANAN
jgi:hypothetical protein